jgi:hypothetical protein
LERFDAEREAFLSWIITGDETWTHHYEPEKKRQSMEWHHPQKPRKQVQGNSLGRKSHDHPLLGHRWSDCETINSDAYIKTLQKLKQRYW